ncbi:MAG: PepSY domain-containing protein [Bacteroidales bacterium]|nr:PepSY domain-containing protein [Bacteroidales bacterium]
MIKFFKKYHKWLGIVLTLFILLFALSGIVLNHRGLFSPFDVSRNILPREYSYKNWNNAAVKSTEKISNDSILIYGNIGVWLTDSRFRTFTDFNKGFPKGIDNRKIERLLFTENNSLFAATLFGLYRYNFKEKLWQYIQLPTHEKRMVDLVEKQDTLFVLSRSFLLKTVDGENFTVKTLPQPENYDNKIGLFKTLWVIHSGEIYGLAGILLVDTIGLVFIFLSITGLVFFINRLRMKSFRRKGRRTHWLQRINSWNLRWHNKIGWTTVLLLIITTGTGMFLRPPLLVAIASTQVSKIPFTELDSPNPWFDKLRRIRFDEEKQRIMLATLDGVFYSDDNFTSKLKKYRIQPPASVMGVNVFKKTVRGTYLVGSFEGLFEWHPEKGIIIDYIKKVPYHTPEVAGPPIGEFLITGMSTDFNNQEVYFGFDKGARTIYRGQSFPPMPASVLEHSPLSLWNLALEIHTARLYKIIFGNYYILFIPLAGFIILFIQVSGFVVWYKRYR